MDATGVCYTQSGNVKRYESGQGPFLHNSNILDDSVDNIFSLSSTYTSDSCDYSVSTIGKYTEEYLLDVAGTYYVDVIYGNTTKQFNYKYNYNKVIHIRYFVALGTNSYYILTRNSVDRINVYKSTGYNAGNNITIYESSYIANNAKFNFYNSPNIYHIFLENTNYEFPSMGLEDIDKYFSVYVSITRSYLQESDLNNDNIKLIRGDSLSSLFSVSDFGIDPGSDIYINICYVPAAVYLDTSWDIFENKSAIKAFESTTDKNYGTGLRTLSTDSTIVGPMNSFLSQIQDSPYALVDGLQNGNKGTTLFAAPVVPRFNGFRTSLFNRKGGSFMTNASELTTIGYDNLAYFPLIKEVITSRGQVNNNSNDKDTDFMYAENENYRIPFPNEDLDNYFFRSTAIRGNEPYFGTDYRYYRNGVTYSTISRGKVTPGGFKLSFVQGIGAGYHYSTRKNSNGNDYSDGNNYNEVNTILQGAMYWDGNDSDNFEPGILTPYFGARCYSSDYVGNVPQFGILTGMYTFKSSNNRPTNKSLFTFSVPTYGGILSKPYDRTFGPYSMTYGIGGDRTILYFRNADNDYILPGSMIVGRIHAGNADGYTGIFWSRFYVNVISNFDFVKKNWKFNYINYAD